MASTFQIRSDGIMDPTGKYPNPLTGRPYSPNYLYQARHFDPEKNKIVGWTTFPPWEHRLEILKRIHKYNIILAIIPPGTGKTVIIPKLLLHYFGYQKKVICTTPKTGTTESAGTFASECLDVPLFAVDDKGVKLQDPNAKGKDKRIDTGNRLVGYTHSAEKRYANSSTLLTFTTDGTVKQKLLSGRDPNFTEYGGVIIDEVHERSINIDILVGLLLDIIKRRPDFKVIFMSATVSKEFFMAYFKRINLGNVANVFEIPGTLPLFKRILRPELKQINQNSFTDVIFQKIEEILMNPASAPGDILGFVTSDSETGKLVKRINKNMAKYPPNGKPYPIAFSANINPIDKAIATGKGALMRLKPTPEAPYGFARKVIIGTNAVESSVTFEDNLVYVIDSGLAYEKKYDPNNYAFITGKFYVSQASIEQRCGRTGRTCDGTCVQLYTTDQFGKLKPYTDPKIIIEDITKDFLGIIALPINRSLQKGLEFLNRMIEDPRNYQASIKRAYENLLNMDLLDSAGNITPLGNVCSNFSKFDIKIGKMCVGAYYLGCLPYAIMLGAILQTVQSLEDVFFKPPDMDENRQLELQYLANIKRLCNPLGDHITLIALYIQWLYAPDQYAFCQQNGLVSKPFDDIRKAYDELYETVLKVRNDIKNLNLFKTPSEILVFGGGGLSGGDSLSVGDGFSGGDSDSSDDEMLSDVGIESLYGGALLGELMSSTAMDNFMFERIDKKTAENFLHGIGGASYIQNNNPDFALLYNDNGNDGGISSGNSPSGNWEYIINGGYIKTKKATYSKAKTRLARLTRINLDSRALITERPLCSDTCPSLVTSLEGGARKKKKSEGAIQAAQAANAAAAEAEKTGKMLKKVMELINMRNIGQRDLTPYLGMRDEERVLAALFYGFSNFIASYTGVGKKYNVRFSSEKASISKSSFDFLGLSPKMVIYNEFTIAKTAGRADDNKLGLVSQLDSKYIGVFNNLHDIKKQLAS